MIVARGGFGCYGAHTDTDCEMRMCSFGFFGATGGDLRVGAGNSPTAALAIERDGAVHDEPFIYAHPRDPADRRAGGICAATGFWAAGHAMTTFKGRKYIREFAPRGE